MITSTRDILSSKIIDIRVYGCSLVLVYKDKRDSNIRYKESKHWLRYIR